MHEDVQTWYAALTDDQREIAQTLRRLVLEQGPDLREELKWGQPCYSLNSVVCYIQKAKNSVSLGFGEGAKLDDPNALLGGSGRQMRHVKIALGDQPDKRALTQLVRDAIKIDSAG